MGDANGNFKSDRHAVRTGLLVGVLRNAGLDASMTVDRHGQPAPVIRIIVPRPYDSYAEPEYYDVELFEGPTGGTAVT